MYILPHEANTLPALFCLQTNIRLVVPAMRVPHEEKWTQPFGISKFCKAVFVLRHEAKHFWSFCH